MSTVTKQELELETAELLPARETLCYSSYGHSFHDHDHCRQRQRQHGAVRAY